MSYIASDVGTIPAQGFNWYVIFFEGMFTNALQKEIDENFVKLGATLGREVLAVRGSDPKVFHDSAYEAFDVQKPEWLPKLVAPAMLVTDTPPKAMEDAEHVKRAKVMIFPLAEIYKERGSITGFFAELVQALGDSEAYEALETVDPARLQRKWGWMTKYVSMNPGFFGFGVKVDEIVQRVIFNQDPPKSFG